MGREGALEASPLAEKRLEADGARGGVFICLWESVITHRSPGSSGWLHSQVHAASTEGHSELGGGGLER